MVATVKLERYITRDSIFSIIVREFGYEWKSYSVVLLVVDIDLEVGLHDTVFSLGLTVYL